MLRLNLTIFVLISAFIYTTNAVENSLSDDSSDEEGVKDLYEMSLQDTVKRLDPYRYYGNIGKRVNNIEPLTEEELDRIKAANEEAYFRDLLVKLKEIIKERNRMQKEKKGIDPYRYMGNIGKK